MHTKHIVAESRHKFETDNIDVSFAGSSGWKNYSRIHGYANRKHVKARAALFGHKHHDTHITDDYRRQEIRNTFFGQKLANGRSQTHSVALYLFNFQIKWMKNKYPVGQISVLAGLSAVPVDSFISHWCQLQSLIHFSILREVQKPSVTDNRKEYKHKNAKS